MRETAERVLTVNRCNQKREADRRGAERRDFSRLPVRQKDCTKNIAPNKIRVTMTQNVVTFFSRSMILRLVQERHYTNLLREGRSNVH